MPIATTFNLFSLNSLSPDRVLCTYHLPYIHIFLYYNVHFGHIQTSLRSFRIISSFTNKDLPFSLRVSEQFVLCRSCQDVPLTFLECIQAQKKNELARNQNRMCHACLLGWHCTFYLDFYALGYLLHMLLKTSLIMVLSLKPEYYGFLSRNAYRYQCDTFY